MMAEEGYAKFGGVFPVERVAPDGSELQMTLEEYAQADLAVEQALRFGKYEALCERLRSATVLLSLERCIAADIIDGTLKRPAHRIAEEDGAAKFRQLHLALSVRVLMDKGAARKAAVEDVRRAQKVSRSQVQKAVKAHPDLLHPSLSK